MKDQGSEALSLGAFGFSTDIYVVRYLFFLGYRISYLAVYRCGNDSATHFIKIFIRQFAVNRFEIVILYFFTHCLTPLLYVVLAICAESLQMRNCLIEENGHRNRRNDCDERNDHASGKHVLISGLMG